MRDVDGAVGAGRSGSMVEAAEEAKDADLRMSHRHQLHSKAYCHAPGDAVRSIVLTLAVSAILCGLVGCHSSSDPHTGQMPGLPKLPPAYPAAKDVPLDPTLQDAAHKELETDLHASDPEVRAHALEAVRNTGGTRHVNDILAALS